MSEEHIGTLEHPKIVHTLMSGKFPNFVIETSATEKVYTECPKHLEALTRALFRLKALGFEDCKIIPIDTVFCSPDKRLNLDN